MDRGARPRHPSRGHSSAVHDRPASVAGLTGAGVIEPGAPAHLTVFGVDDPFPIDAAALLHKNPITAYDHRLLTGRIRRTWLHGKAIYNVTEGGAGEAPRSGASRAGAAVARGRTAG